MEIQTSDRPIDTLLEKVLSMNILSSDYFKELYRLKTYHEVIDEIYNQVDHVEPWMTGNCRGPSTAFCLLYKFFTMKLTVKQMHGLLKHPDSPYIRAIQRHYGLGLNHTLRMARKFLLVLMVALQQWEYMCVIFFLGSTTLTPFFHVFPSPSCAKLLPTWRN
ncbi:pre-mRNA splicing factor SR-like 1 isoform X2 [Musa acuminata AAA Group]|uniref:pre-mRNA splicing factor SR-like 1 isoform X2 n=1 Tax=Musa acuminata AAA Group TaxID=214697 RepID=UPI0031E01100